MEKRSSGLLQRTQRRRMGKRPWATLRNPKGSARRQGLTVEDVGPPPNVPFVSPPSYLSNHPIPVALLTILIIILLFPLDLKIYRYPHHFLLARRQRMPMLRTDDALMGERTTDPKRRHADRHNDPRRRTSLHNRTPSRGGGAIDKTLGKRMAKTTRSKRPAPTP